jgi:hypothetical protein
MTITEEIQHEVLDLPADLQVNVLDFIQHLKQERGMARAPDKLFPPTNLEDIVGCLRYHGPPKKVEETPSNRIGNGLDAFIGIWSEQEEQEFNAAVAAMEQIDEELWQ